MAGQRGFLYEGRVFNKLKSKNLVPAGVIPGGTKFLDFNLLKTLPSYRNPLRPAIFLTIYF